MTDTPMHPDPEQAGEENKAPLSAHLLELRKRLLIVMAVMLVGTGFCFGIMTDLFNNYYDY